MMNISGLLKSIENEKLMPKLQDLRFWEASFQNVVPCPIHLSFGVVQLFLQLSIIFPALFCFVSSREFCHFENM
jgi:hypothetical protein